jgi:hypothetical protein
MEADEVLPPSHRSGQQHERQGNVYGNVTVEGGARALLGDVYADTYSENVLDQPHHPQKTEQEKKEDFLNELRFTGSYIDQGHVTAATPLVPLTSRSPSLVRRPSSTVPLNTEDGYTTLDSVIDPRLLLPAETFLDTHPQNETATQAQVDELFFQTYGQAPIRDDSASAGHSADRATSQYFAKQNDKYTTTAMNAMAHHEWVQQSAPPPQFLRYSRNLSPPARPYGCEEPGCPKRFKDQAGLRYVSRKSE